MIERLRIDRLGHRGDGVVDGASGPVYVPYALPGETVDVDREGDRGSLVEVVVPSPVRVAPLCRHFGECGGCAVQHLRRENYLAWKQEMVRAALAQRGLEAAVEGPLTVPPRSRRRAVFAARRTARGILLGYHARQSHRIVPIAECPVVMPAIERAMPLIAQWLAPLVPLRTQILIGVTATQHGLDVALEGPTSRPPAILPRIAASRPAGLDLARLSIAGEPVLVLAEPEVDIGGAAVALPPLAFLQAAEAAERAMAGLVTGWLDSARSVADLYAGIGTFTLRLAGRARVLAVDGDRAALAALEVAARHARGLKPVETLVRDLWRQPMSAAELDRHQGVVFDPPRAGAPAQAEEIARSKVPRVAAVSCNPATLARDLRVLVDGGYALRRVVPVDQFVHAAHIEAVALLERETAG